MLFLVIGLFELLVMKSTGYGIEKQQRERYNRDPLKDLVSIYLVFSYYNSRESLRWQFLDPKTLSIKVHFWEPKDLKGLLLGWKMVITALSLGLSLSFDLYLRDLLTSNRHTTYNSISITTYGY